MNQQQIISYFTTNVLPGTDISDHWVAMCCVTLAVSRSAVSRALTTMRRQGLLRGRVLGRTHLPAARFAEAVAEAGDAGMLLDADRADALCRHFLCDRRTLDFAAGEAESLGMVSAAPTGGRGVLFTLA